MKLLTALRSEILKTKRTASFYFSLAGAAPVPAILLLNMLTSGGDFRAVQKDPLNTIFELGAERNSLVFFPMFLILVCTLLPQIEFRNNTWKQVLAAPLTKANVFVAKFLNINLLILLFIVASFVFMSLVIVVTHFYHPTLNLLNQPFNWTKLLTQTANSYVAMLAVCAIQFWLGLRFRNFIIPTAVGLTLWFTGMMMIFEFESDLVNYFPYSFQVFPFVAKLQPKMIQVALTSSAYAAIILFLGFLDFRRRRLTSH